TKKSSKKTPTPEPEEAEGAVFTADSFDFAFRYDDSVWTVTSNPLGSGDLVSLKSESSLLLSFLVSDQFDDLQNCLNIMSGYGTSVLEGVGVTGDLNMQGDAVEITKGNRAGSVAVLASFTVIDGDFPDALFYIECGPVNDSAYMVGVIQISIEQTFEADAEARQAIVDSFGSIDDVQSANQDPEPTKASTKKTATPKSGKTGNATLTANVVATDDGGALYTSPSFGFQVGILPDYTVEEDSVQNGYDTLVVASGSSRVTYSMFASTNTPDGCIASIVTNLFNTAGYTNVQVATADDGTELSGTGDGFAYTVILFTSNGQDIARYYACFGGGSGGAILVFAYESPLAVFADQVEEIETMLDQIIIPE
ncbi:MAG TPA: hypothetical protein PK691_07360, partial [Thermomicrobiales bacterium]|nr:hypothetical protein [Thermomicrobiales bacterium]